MGNTALSQGRTQDAITHYTQAIDLNPSNAIYYGNRAAAHMSLFAAVEAAADSARSVELDPSYWKGYYRLGQAKLYLGDSQEAKESFTKAVSLTNDLNMKNSILQLLVTCEADLAQAQIEDLFEQLRQEKQRSWRLKEQIDAQKRFAEHANKKQPEKEQLGKGDSELASKTLEEKEDFVISNADIQTIIRLQALARGYITRKALQRQQEDEAEEMRRWQQEQDEGWNFGDGDSSGSDAESDFMYSYDSPPLRPSTARSRTLTEDSQVMAVDSGVVLISSTAKRRPETARGPRKGWGWDYKPSIISVKHGIKPASKKVPVDPKLKYYKPKPVLHMKRLKQLATPKRVVVAKDSYFSPALFTPKILETSQTLIRSGEFMKRSQKSVEKFQQRAQIQKEALENPCFSFQPRVNVSSKRISAVKKQQDFITRMEQDTNIRREGKKATANLDPTLYPFKPNNSSRGIDISHRGNFYERIERDEAKRTEHAQKLAKELMDQCPHTPNVNPPPAGSKLWGDSTSFLNRQMNDLYQRFERPSEHVIDSPYKPYVSEVSNQLAQKRAQEKSVLQRIYKDDIEKRKALHSTMFQRALEDFQRKDPLPKTAVAIAAEQKILESHGPDFWSRYEKDLEQRHERFEASQHPNFVSYPFQPDNKWTARSKFQCNTNEPVQRRMWNDALRRFNVEYDRARYFKVHTPVKERFPGVGEEWNFGDAIKKCKAAKKEAEEEKQPQQ